MRLSAQRGSPFYNARLANRAQVYWEGIPLSGCVEASEFDGWADCVVADDAGSVVRDGDRAKIERRTGQIRIVILPE